MTLYKKMGICEPIDQLKLYGYEAYFRSFENLHKKNKLPNVFEDFLKSPTNITDRIVSWSWCYPTSWWNIYQKEYH